MLLPSYSSRGEVLRLLLDQMKEQIMSLQAQITVPGGTVFITLYWSLFTLISKDSETVKQLPQPVGG